MTKSVHAAELADPETGLIEFPDWDKTRLYTLAMMKYTGCRTILSKKFCDFLGVTQGTLDPRLVELCNELKRLKARKKYLEMIETKYGASLGWVLMPECAELREIPDRIAQIKER